MSIAWPEGTKDTIDEIRGVVGRQVTIYVKEGQSPCLSGCGYDPVNDASVDAFCTGCDGQYWIETISGYSLSGHVRWGSIDQTMWTAGGWIPEGQCKVTVEHSELNLDHVTRSQSWLVDGKTMYLKNFQFRGIRGDDEVHGPSRIAVFLKQEERQK